MKKIIISDKFKIVYTRRNFIVMIVFLFLLNYLYILITYENRNSIEHLRFQSKISYLSKTNWVSLDWVFEDDLIISILDKEYRLDDFKKSYEEYNINKCFSWVKIFAYVPDTYLNIYNGLEDNHFLISKSYEVDWDIKYFTMFAENVNTYLRFYKVKKVKILSNESKELLLKILKDCKK